MSPLLPILALGFALDAAPLPDRPRAAKETHMVPMSDGVRLATDVYFPLFGQGPWPTLLVRTPYNKNTEILAPLWRFSGYAVVVQDLRGRFASGGLDRVFIDDGWGLPIDDWPLPRRLPGRDGLETCQWIEAQSWCDGHLGTMGASALGVAQNYIAGTPDNGVECQWIAVAFSDPYSQNTYQGGAFRESLVEGWLEYQNSMHMLPLYERHPRYDPLWRWTSPEQRVEKMEQPAVHVGGWYDIFSKGTLNGFVTRQERGGVGARAKQKLIIGPWAHYIGNHHVGELTYPGAGFTTPFELVGSDADWFAYWLKEEPNDIFEKPPIAYYQMGPTDLAGPRTEWRTLEGWPPPSEPHELYLQASGLLADTPQPSGPASTSYLFDPNDPVPTIGGANLNIDMGPMDQSAVEDRDDVLVFRTEPLVEALETAGEVLVDLWISSDARDTDFTVKLIDEYPDGRSMLVCDGVLRARYRDGFAQEKLLVPGEVVPITVDLWSTAITFGPGHRIGVDVSSSNYPRFDVNPNTGEKIHRHTHMVPATNALYHDEARASRIVLRATDP